MNAKRLFLSGIITTTCLAASVAMAAPSASHGSVSAFRGGMSRPAFTATRPAFTPRMQPGLTSATHIPNTRPGIASASSARNWTANGNNWHHRRHCNDFVFIGGFYPYSWYYPYGYGYYPYNQPVVYEDVGSDDGSLVVQVQSRLARAGYYHGAIDGIMGSETRRAIRAYERAHSLRVDGMIDDRLLSTMNLR